MAEISTGRMVNGVIVLDEGTPTVPEGARVRVEQEGREGREMEAALKELSDGLLELAGTLEGLPEDFAENHDHYIHGQPRR